MLATAAGMADVEDAVAAAVVATTACRGRTFPHVFSWRGSAPTRSRKDWLEMRLICVRIDKKARLRQNSPPSLMFGYERLRVTMPIFLSPGQDSDCFRQ